jgi:4'-phosphopantetheinyl transferase
VGIEPRHLSFSVNEWGKPRLVTDGPTQDIRFSQTRSRNWSLLAVSNSGELGIDLEYMDPSLDVDSLIQFLSPDEAEELNTTPTAFRREAFFRCWSRKEAYLKAVGEGLRAALSGFSVPAHGRVLPQPVPVRKTSACDDPWFLIDLQAVDGFAASLVTKVPSKAICFQDPSLVL